MAAASSSSQPADLRLPPGFRFQPTDKELIIKYLKPRVSNPNFKVDHFLIKEFDVFSVEPWRLPGDSFQYQSEQMDMYFLTPRHLISKGSQRASRMAGSGFWQGKGRDNHIEIETKVSGAIKTEVIGHRAQLTYMANKGTGYMKTDWIMHEFRQHSKDDTKFDNLVLCRIHKKKTKRGREEMVDRDVGEEEEDEVVEGRLAKRRRTDRDVGKEEEAVPLLDKPAGQEAEEEKELEMQVIMGMLREHALMKANGWTPSCGVINTESCFRPMSSSPAYTSLQNLPSLESLENREVLAPMTSDVGCVSFSPEEEARQVNLVRVEERRLMACNDETTALEACNGETTPYEVVDTESEVVNTESSVQSASSLLLGMSDTPDCFGDESDGISLAEVLDSDGTSVHEIFDFSNIPPWEDVLNDLDNGMYLSCLSSGLNFVDHDNQFASSL